MASWCREFLFFTLFAALCYEIDSSEDNNFEASSDIFSKSNSGNVTLNPIIIDKNCSSAFQHFSKSLMNFTQCSVEYARPIRICMKCSGNHSVVVKAYNQLKQQTTDCQEFFFGSDQLGVVDVMYSTVTSLWTKSSCQSCSSHHNETMTFFLDAHKYIDCVTANWSAANVSNSTCEECEPAYANLTRSFHKFVTWEKNLDEKICMDIIDTMNISRRLWKDYSCFIVFGTDIGFPNVLTALTVGATPVMFYLLAKNISRLEDVKIVRPKRKFAASHPPPPVEQ